ncbi:HD family phosphohydrolase [Carnobacterium funditum]|uniref:HD family phosphohydrolase n=1 Tax=Carnobacterium funditum TaxID=2752 RepID=UPI00054F8121|nr:HDIG domain-containing metalloprotein [Carnobacterium funditum]
MRRRLTAIQNKMGKMYIPILLLLFSTVLFFIMFSSVKPRELDIKLYQVADETIRAQSTVEDLEKTIDNRQIAANNVAPVYSYNADLNDIQTEKIHLLFATVKEANKLAEEQFQEKLKEATSKTNSNSKEESTTSNANIKKLTPNEKLVLFNTKLINNDEETKEFVSSLPEWSILELLGATEVIVNQIEKATTKTLSEAMSIPIRVDELSKKKQEAIASLDYWEFKADQKRVAGLILDNSLVENNVYNEQVTEKQRESAKISVQPALILQGQVIVQEGHVIDSNVMNQIKLLGLLDNTSSYHLFYSLFLILLSQALVLFYLGKTKKDSLLKKGQELTLYTLIMTSTLMVLKGLSLMQQSGLANINLLYPAALAPILLTTFSSRRYGIVANGFLVAFSVFLFRENTGTNSIIMFTLFYLFSGMMGTMITKKRIINQFLNTFMWISFFNALFISSLILYLNLPFLSRESLLIILFALGSGLLSYFLAILFSPYIELLFADNAVLTLMKLENPTNSLLKELVTKTPGTYHHSLMVANLSANAVGSIGGDSLFARVACYYHDVGKLRHSLFFVENLSSGMENPHNLLTPFESRDIIFGHVSEGVKILKEAKMPQSIIDICAQHHGTTLMKFFYIKAKELDETVQEAEFRYPGPKPQTKEAAVINIADSAEAAVRSMTNPTKETIEIFIHQLVNDRMTDGQFDECSISIKELKIVEQSICEGLNGTFHSRIEYPSLSEKDTNKNNA